MRAGDPKACGLLEQIDKFRERIDELLEGLNDIERLALPIGTVVTQATLWYRAEKHATRWCQVKVPPGTEQTDRVRLDTHLGEEYWDRENDHWRLVARTAAP